MSIRYQQYDSEEGYDETADLASPDREISLGTTTVLGIFLALALVCALFFGFGYSMGRRSVPGALANVNTGISAPLPESKPTPGSLSPERPTYVPPTQRAVPDAASGTDLDSGVAAPAGQKTKPSSASSEAAIEEDASVSAFQRKQVARAIEQVKAPIVRVPPAASAPAPAMPAPTSTGSSYVQIAAISATHREDAEMLLGSLKRRGYAAAIRPGAQDQLLHVQIGPLASKKDADAMRQRLMADGYNAIVK